MTVQIHLPTELEAELRGRAAEAGVDVETFLTNAVTNQLRSAEETRPKKKSRNEFLAAIQAIIDKHPGFGDQVDDSRESIYSGRE